MLFFVPFFHQLFRFGHLTVIDAQGRCHVFSGQPLDGLPPVTIRLHDAALHWRLVWQPSLAVGEAYMDGRLTIEQGSLDDFLALATENLQRTDHRFPRLTALASLLRRLPQEISPAAARCNVAHHYDLSETFYRLFLESDMLYSCAYFAEPQMTLEQAQDAKKRHIIAKLLLQPGQRVLDIGCGWGGLGLSIARACDVEVVGITLSEKQLRVARRRAEEAQLSHRVQFQLIDYREISGRFDRIVSVGMFEHVGLRQYRLFFQRLRQLLSPRGIALLHAIGRSYGPDATNPWILKYIFPGGYSPALSQVLAAVEPSGLIVTDIEILRHHYAETLRHWRQRFLAHRAEAAALYDERFCRMWEFYLTGAESAFRHQGHMVWQMQLADDPIAVPETRDYIGLGSSWGSG